MMKRNTKRTLIIVAILMAACLFYIEGAVVIVGSSAKRHTKTPEWLRPISVPLD